MSARRCSLESARAVLPPDVRQKWYGAFNEFDVTKNGVITAAELEEVMKASLNMSPAPGEVMAMIEAVDRDNDQAVNYEEFELMMIAAGRGENGGRLGFSHVVDRFIRMSDVAALVAQECNGFVDQFCQAHMEKFQGLETWDVSAVEQQPAWYDVYRQFVEEAELTVQNALILWGTATTKCFDEDFLDIIGNTGIIENFLRYSDYKEFVKKMYETKRLCGDQHPGIPATMTPRPETPCGSAMTQSRLATIDRKLAMIDYQRNQLLAERRRLVGCEVQPVTFDALRRELDMRRWREEVGND